MIKTQSYNDFSSFTSDEKKDYKFMLEQIKEFKKNGGDLSLPVQVNKPKDNSEINLITLNSFISQYICDYYGFLNELKEHGINLSKIRKETICDFTWDAATGSITEKANYGMYWMRDNFNQFKDEILQAFKNLLDELPNDIHEIKNYYQVGSYGKLEQRSFHHPLYTLSEEINRPELYDLIFKSRPEMTNEFSSTSIITKAPNFCYILNVHKTNRLKDNANNYDVATTFIKHGIGIDYFIETENLNQLHQLIKRACYTRDIDFLNIVLPKINLYEIEKDKIFYENSLSKAQDVEIANLLLNHNALVEITNSNGVTNSLIFDEAMTSVEVFDFILQRFPKYQEQIKNEPKNFYRIMQNKNFGFTKLLVEKYQFPLENFDMLSIAYNKTSQDNFDDYKWLIQYGADVRENASFLREMVEKKDIGLKIIRGLNKEGIIVSKSPDFIFNVFQNRPAKNFTTYYDKLTSKELEKTTKDGLPAWFGAKAYADYNFMFSRIKNYDQTAQDGKNLLFHILEMQLTNREINASAIIKLQLKKIHEKDPEYKLDLSYTDANGNNFMHHLLAFRKYVKENIDFDLLELLQDNTKQNVFEFISKENKEGVSPLDLLITQDNLSNYDLNPALKLIIEKASEHINFSKFLSSGRTLGDHFLEEFAFDSNMKSFIQATILEQELSFKNSKETKKLKL